MEELRYKYTNFKNALESLEKTIATRKKFTAIQQDPDLSKSLMSAVIKDFELVYETAWKFLKQYLTEIREITVSSPRETFRTAYIQNIIPENVSAELIELVDIRNRTTHTYDRLMAQKVCDEIEKHYKVLRVVLESINIPA